MASTKCTACNKTAVRKAGQVCASCVRQGVVPQSELTTLPLGESGAGQATPIVPPTVYVQRVLLPADPPPMDEPTMEEREPRAIVERQLRQATVVQRRIQAVIDDPRIVACAICGENEAVMRGLEVDYVLDAHVKMAKVLGAVLPLWQKVATSAEQVAESLGRDEMIELFEGWFSRLPSPVQRDVMQGMTRVYNSRVHAKPTG